MQTLQHQYQQLLSLAMGSRLTGESFAGGGDTRFYRVRDLHIFPLLGDLSLVVACDSNASIGEKPHDGLSKPYAEVGISALKVPLMEVLATGAQPFLIINALCMEMNPSGVKLIQAMRQELSRCGFDPDLMLTGSTEDNVATVQSGIGVTVLGFVARERLRVGSTRVGDVLLCVGNPKGGVELPYAEGDADIASISTVQTLTMCNEVHEILPVGSKGVLFEANEMVQGVGGRLQGIDVPPSVSLTGSAGASTAVLVSTESQNVEKITRLVDKPVYVIGIVQ